ncbi:hypothetical protein K2173_012701 [Erythroxylum novogranatense]|uniref:Bacterial bifunctional deaminase-reductase C-terminal domain-containing protein n=1 Tax=Erythroxylum novogranatense TaxID=1862640 RepID=A0AAV8TW21_9ROSI|nr:hypothetical protein K2173_012701 [Erythroxylum novogranatense]
MCIGIILNLKIEYEKDLFPNNGGIIECLLLFLPKTFSTLQGGVKDATFIKRTAQLADLSAGFTSPYLNFSCIIATPSGKIAGKGFPYAQGTKPVELLVVKVVDKSSKGFIAYLNMEPGDCHGDHTVVSALVQGGVSRVVIGIRHPLSHLQGNAVRAQRSPGLQVDVLQKDLKSKIFEVRSSKAFLLMNAPLIHRVASCVPISLLKYAMTLDVFELRGRSDVIIVGGNTLHRDNSRLTGRHGSGHMPIRIVMTQTLDLLEEEEFSKLLASKGAEVVEFNILNPREVVEYFHDRGYLCILWECGGTLAAYAISAGVIHKIEIYVHIFIHVAHKILTISHLGYVCYRIIPSIPSLRSRWICIPKTKDASPRSFISKFFDRNFLRALYLSMLPRESLLVLNIHLQPIDFAPLGNSTRSQTPLSGTDHIYLYESVPIVHYSYLHLFSLCLFVFPLHILYRP